MRTSLRSWDLAPLAAMVVFCEKLWFLGVKTGKLIDFPAPLIVPDQKETVGALNAVVVTVVEYVRLLLGADGVCTCRHSDAQVSRDQRVRV